MRSTLRRLGILGMNERNRRYIQGWNDRRLYPLVDDKLKTKALCREHGLAAPELLGSIRHQGELPLLEKVAQLERFVLKPAGGAMGNGILVITGRDGDDYIQPNGTRRSFAELRFHALDILAGLYALGGREDQVVVEECLTVHPALAEVSAGGVPDLRIVVHRNVPAMAMLRLPTERSRGRANLHQGAIGAGVSIASGHTVAAVMSGRFLRHHPDTGADVVGVAVPGWRDALRLAVRAAELTGLGYLGADIVVDRDRGPLVLELNARPGLAIQIANRAGLLRRLEAIDRRVDAPLEAPVDVPLDSPRDTEERIALGEAIEAGR